MFAMVTPDLHYPPFYHLETQSQSRVAQDAFDPSVTHRADEVARILGHAAAEPKWHVCPIKPDGDHVKPGVCYYMIPDAPGTDPGKAADVGPAWFVVVKHDRPADNFGRACLEGARQGYAPPAVMLPPQLGATCTRFVGTVSPDDFEPATLTRESIRRPEVMRRVVTLLAEMHNTAETRRVSETPHVTGWPRDYADDTLKNLKKWTPSKDEANEHAEAHRWAATLAQRLRDTANIEVADNGDMHYDNVVRVGGEDAATANLYAIDLHDIKFFDPMYSLARLAYTSRLQQKDLESLLDVYFAASQLKPQLGTFTQQLQRLRTFSALMNVTYLGYHHRDCHDSNPESLAEIRRRIQEDKQYL